MPTPHQTAVERIEELGQLSDDPHHLVRTFLSRSNLRAAASVIHWMEKLGMETAHAKDGTVRGILPGSNPEAPPLLLGSHIDTVINAGKYDGPLGVVSSLAALEILAEQNITLPFPVHVLGFSDEEGVRFQTTYLGSRSIIGELDHGTLNREDAKGQSLAFVLATLGWHDQAEVFHYAPSETLGYVELHIEQGRILEEANEPACIVTSIMGQTRLRITFTGHADHAGTTPMNLRSDALTGSAEAILAIENIARQTDSLVATVGQVQVQPNVSNSIPQEVTFTIDIRHPNDDVRHQAEADIEAEFTRITKDRNLQYAWQIIQGNDATPCEPKLTNQLLNSLTAITGHNRLLPSGAGHDGVVLAPVMPIGMIFVRCRDGLSHHPDEYATPEDIATGINILTHFLKTFEPSPT
ncbi:MAG: M20 family metallo-hydrolase [Roseibacillus sp.]